MTIKSAIKDIVGKTIVGVVVKENGNNPPTQVFLAFSDDTYYEFYGLFNSAAGIDRGGTDKAEEYARKFPGAVTRYG